MIQKASAVAFYNNPEWDELSFANKTILGLKMEQAKEPDEKQRKEIAVIEEMYKSKKKKIIENMVVHDEQLIKDGKITFNNDTGEVYIPNVIETMNNKERGVNNMQTNKNEYTQITNNDIIITQNEVMNMNDAMNDETTVKSDDTKSLAESAKAINPSIENTPSVEMEDMNLHNTVSSSLQRRSKNQQDDNQSAKENHGSAKPSYSQAIIGENNMMNKNNAAERKTIRIRFQFKANNIPVEKNCRSNKTEIA